MSGHPRQPLRIPSDILEKMIGHCRVEAPREACGLLAGVNPQVASWFPLRNALASETRYRADERELVAAVVAIRGRGEEILAIYHSHPRWPAVPSSTDLAENYYGDVARIIVSLLDDPPDVRAYTLRPDGYDELAWERVASDHV